jgi:hypothetical protein
VIFSSTHVLLPVLVLVAINYPFSSLGISAAQRSDASESAARARASEAESGVGNASGVLDGQSRRRRGGTMEARGHAETMGIEWTSCIEVHTTP